MISERINHIQESGSIALVGKIAALRKQGHHVVSLSLGEPDLAPHPNIVAATKAALDRDETKYSLVHGIVPLREELALKMKRDHQIDVGIDQILLSNGSKQTLYNIFQMLCNPGDEIIVPAPYWVTIPEAIRLAGGVPVFLESSDLIPDPKAIEAAITKRTRGIIINSPNNPTGLVFGRELLKTIGEIAVKNNLVLISDEAYEALTYDAPHISAASLSPEIFEHTLTVQSFSKTYCMTGFRMGYVVGPQKYIQAMYKLQSHMTGNNCTFAQYGALAALQLPPEYLENYRADYLSRRDLAYARAKKIFDLPKPQGAFYLFPKVTQLLKQKGFQSSEELSHYILEKSKVALLPGTFFGLDGYLRLSFAASPTDINEAFDRLEKLF